MTRRLSALRWTCFAATAHLHVGAGSTEEGNEVRPVVPLQAHQLGRQLRRGRGRRPAGHCARCLGVAKHPRVCNKCMLHMQGVACTAAAVTGRQCTCTGCHLRAECTHLQDVFALPYPTDAHPVLTRIPHIGFADVASAVCRDGAPPQRSIETCCKEGCEASKLTCMSTPAWPASNAAILVVPTGVLYRQLWPWQRAYRAVLNDTVH